MAYTDKELKQATQVAYLDCLEKALKNFEGEEHDGPYSLKELITASIDYNSMEEKAREEGKSINGMSLQEMIKYSDLRDQDKEIIEGLTDDTLEWKMADIHDMTSVNGFYGCVIETDNEDAIVAFRGSEGFETYSGLVYDWVQADFGLLNSKETYQQQETERYADKLAKKGILDKYNSVAVTGHSLGGNLASHFAVVNAYDEGTRESTFNKIDQVVNFDGPGVSDEYLKYFDEGIEKATPKITHYKWSAVGSLLYDLPGEKDEFLKIDEEQHKDSLLDRIKYKTFLRHDTRSLLFDDEGNAERGKQDVVAKIFDKLSKTAETIPAMITKQIGYLATSIFSHIIYEKEDGTIGYKLPFSNKGEKRVNKDAGEKIQCGELLDKSVEKYVEYARCIEMTKGGKTEGYKSGYEDVFEAAVNDEEYNMNNFNNSIEMFKAGQNIRRENNKDIEGERVS